MLLDEALDAPVVIEQIYVESSALDPHGRHAALLERARLAGVELREVRDGALAKVLDLGSPQGMVAVAGIVEVAASQVIDAAVAAAAPVLVAVEIADPGNLGTLVRVAEASGCAGVLLSVDSVDVHNPKVVRAAAGSTFRLPVSEAVDVFEAIRLAQDAGLHTAATVPRDGSAPEAVDLSGAVAVVVGSEAHGLAADVVERCDRRVTIPMAGGVESLNAAVAAAAVLLDAARQRRTGARPGARRPSATERSGGDGAPVGHDGGASTPGGGAQSPSSQHLETDR